GAVVTEAVDRVAVAAQARGIEVGMAAEDELEVFGDAELLTTAVANLLANAVNYSDERTHVGIGARRVGDTVELAVTDQGQGIPATEQGRIFERFYRVDAARSRATGGTGLGLAIVKHICANHGGDVSVWSREGRGSTFTMRLPAAGDQSAVDESADDPAQGSVAVIRGESRP
ncbi:MAG: sensor histidine kinase, partial [Phycicoccus sp.]